MMTKKYQILFFYVFLFFVSCGNISNNNNSNSLNSIENSFLNNYADLAYANYSDVLKRANKMQESIEFLTLNPTKLNLDNARESWLLAREPYGQSEAFRFSGGPIDTDLSSGLEGGVEGQLNAWPLDEAHIDYVSKGTGNETGLAKNIINDTVSYPEINKDLLLSLNETGSEKNISLGWHAIEFLLWGQDSENVDLKTPGNRSFEDFKSNKNAKRRALYLSLATQILVDDITFLVNEWSDHQDNFRKKILASSPKESILKITRGLGQLSYFEFAQERIAPGVENGQEDEHSCFSDNTHRDVILNAKGIQNIYSGYYTTINGDKIGSGFGLHKVVKVLDEQLADEILTLTNQTVNYAENIPVPYDYAITLENREDIINKNDKPISNTYHSFYTQGQKLYNDVSYLINMKL